MLGYYIIGLFVNYIFKWYFIVNDLYSNIRTLQYNKRGKNITCIGVFRIYFFHTWNYLKRIVGSRPVNFFFGLTGDWEWDEWEEISVAILTIFKTRQVTQIKKGMSLIYHTLKLAIFWYSKISKQLSIYYNGRIS